MYFKPYIIVYGGNNSERLCDGLWALNVNVNNTPFRWEEIVTTPGKPVPEPRLYHSCSIWNTHNKTQMILVFGGRNSKSQALNDLWGLRRHNNGEWDWLQAPYRANVKKPDERYQHSAACYQNLFFVVGGRRGGRADPESGGLSLEVFNLDNSEWYSLNKIKRFRHVSWIAGENLYVHGGEPAVQSQSEDGVMFRIDLRTALNVIPGITFKSPAELKEARGDGKDGRYQTPHLGGYSLSNNAIVAEPYNNEATIRKVKIADLEREGIKIHDEVRVGHNMGNESLKDLAQAVVEQLVGSGKWTPPYDNSFPLDHQTMITILDKVTQVLRTGTPLLRLRPPVKIFGSIHGQFGDLLRLFEEFGSPVDTQYGASDLEGLDYLFLGNYVDRGRFSLEVVFLLLALKILHPKQIHLLRGSHEEAKINMDFGLGEECKTRLKEDILSEASVYKKLNKVFEFLPLGATIADKIFCVHSGVGENLRTLKEISSLKLPLKVNYSPVSPNEKAVIDLLWSDPVLSESEKQNQVIFCCYFIRLTN